MSMTRRVAFAHLALGGLIGVLLTRRAEAQTYTYDALGRVVSVEHNGSVVTYTYDDAGNRTQVVRAAAPPSPPPPLPPPPPVPPPTFTQTIQVTGTGPVNLRALANANGYLDVQNATITFEVSNGVTIAGVSGGGTAIDTGLWPTGSKTISLALTVKTGGIVRGGGGNGGMGGDGGGWEGPGQPGTRGGDAIYCRVPISITIQSGGQVRGGGGGGGGAATVYEGWPEPQLRTGGGGGGGAPNGLGGAGDGGASAGANGNTASGGAGGSGYEGGVNGGNGGGYGANGNNGEGWLSPPMSGGAGGVGGYCIRKNGFTVPVTNNGTTSGTIG